MNNLLMKLAAIAAMLALFAACTKTKPNLHRSTAEKKARSNLS